MGFWIAIAIIIFLCTGGAGQAGPARLGNPARRSAGRSAGGSGGTA